jgi:transcriptional regulator with XRE-family HTH domain
VISQDKLRSAIRTIIQRHGLSNEEFGRSIGISKMMVSYILSGQRNLKLKNVQKLCQTWGLDIDTLLEDEHKKKASVAEAVNEVLRIQKLRPDDLCEKTGIDLLTINQIQRGIKSPSEEELEMLADVLQIEKDVLEEGVLLSAFNDIKVILERIHISEEAIDAVMRYLEREIQKRASS